MHYEKLNAIECVAQRRKGRQGNLKPEKTRSPKFETNPNDQKTNPNRPVSASDVLDFGFQYCGLFRISSFGFRIFD
jgi:hypothetical protein